MHRRLASVLGSLAVVASMVTMLSSSPAAAAGPSSLGPNAHLSLGASLSSPSGSLTLVMQEDGNLVLYSATNQPLWWTNTSGKPTTGLTVQPNGNVVIDSTSGAVLWQTHTAGNPGSQLVVTNTGQVDVIAAGGVVLWSSVAGTTGNTQSSLAVGGSLLPGASLLSPTGGYRATLSTLGTLSVTGPSGTLWSTPSLSSPAAALEMKANGNLVLVGSRGQSLWFTRTANSPGNHLVLTSAGQLEVVTPGNLIAWDLGTTTGNGGAVLGSGQSLSSSGLLISPNATHTASVLGSGAFVMAPTYQTPEWSTKTAGGTSLVMQADGNLVLYSAANQPLWWSNTSGNPGAHLVLEDVGALVIASPSGRQIWALAPTLAAKIVTIAQSQDQYTQAVHEQPMGSNCNPYSTFFGRGSSGGCSGGLLEEEWCSDFANWVWLKAGANTAYLSGWSFNFVRNGQSNGTFQPGATDDPQPGDAVVYGSLAQSYGAHVGIVTDVVDGQIDMVSGNWSNAVIDAGFLDPATMTVDGYGIVGFIAPVPAPSAGARSARRITAPKVTPAMIATQDGGR